MDSRSFIQQLSSPIPSISALAALLLAPLDSVSLLSPSLRHKYLDSQSHSFNPQDFKPSFITDVQKLIIEKILADWNEVLSEEDRKVKKKRGKSKQLEGLQDSDEDLSLLEIILQLWFYPTSREDFGLDSKTLQNSDQTSSSSGQAKRDSKAKICVSSLRVCSSLLSRRVVTSKTSVEKNSSSLHPSSSKYLIEILVQYQSRVHLGLLLEGAFSEKNKAQQKLTWEDTVKNLVSLPDKVANFTEGKPPDSLERDFFLSTVSSQLEDAIYRTSISQPSQSERLDFISSLLSKLIRTGFVSSIPQANNSRSIQPSFWESTLISVSSRLNAASKTKELWPPAYQSTWQALLSRLAVSERLTFCKSLIVFLDSFSLSQGGISTLIASNELGKIGREGSNFLSSESKERIELVSEILDLFCSKGSEKLQSEGGPQDDESESGSESESEDTDISITLMEVLMPNGKELGLVGSPLLARSISFWALKQLLVSKEGDSSLFVESFFEKVVNVWSNPARIRTANLSQEEYLATLFLTLLCHLRDLHSTSSKTSSFLSRISHLPSFLNGVSTHLDHLDPSIRRFGMLIAEIMSSFTSNSVSQEGDKIKKLDFGKTVWDGIGQGKEEARVLRAFVDGWKLHDPSTSTKFWTREEMRKSLGIESVQETKKDAKVEIIEVISSEEIKSINEKQTRPQPQTRSLPAKVPPPKKVSSNSNELPSLFPVNSHSNSRSLIQSLSDSEDERESDSSDSLQAYDDRTSDSSGSSSYEEDSSSESDGEGIAEQMGSALGLDEEGLKRAKEAAGGNEESNQSGLDPGVPKKKRKLPPVYVAELIPLLQANTREKNRLGLRNAISLIERKAGWGGEVDENAIQLISALCGIGNNWRIKDFEKRRTGALAALIVASPRIATGSVIEQYFIHQYSSVQRFAMLDALASASRDLAGLSPLFTEETTLKETTLKSSSNLKTASSIAESITKDAMKRAKEDGEGHVPSIAREKSLTMNTRLQPTRAVQELGSSNNNKNNLARRGFTNSVRPKERYIDLAGSVFIFPLIQRFWSHLQEASTKSRRARSSSYGGAGTGTLFSPMMISRFLDALSVMVHSSQNSLDFLAVISPEILELVLGVARDGISLGLRSISSSTGGDLESEGEGGDVVSTINSSLAGLALTVLDSSWEIERSKTLRRDKMELVGRIGYWASEAFDREEKKNSGNQINAGSSGRAARISAAVVLRVAEIRGEWKENMLGF